MNTPCRAVAALVSSVLISSANAHEYWLDPLDATIILGQPLLADIRNGQDYVGDAYPFDPHRYNVASVTGPEGVEPLFSRIGDYPAIRSRPGTVGLYRIALETTDSTLDYDTVAKYQTFAAYHGLGDLLSRHRERGLPPNDVSELFARFTTLFVDVRRADGTRAPATTTDEVLQPAGLVHELVPDSDPYSGDSVTLTVLFRGKPRADAQVERFLRREGGLVERLVARSDVEGQVTFDIATPGDYLFNSVQVLELDGDVPWRSLWASMVIERR